jgi:hypothetical protein
MSAITSVDGVRDLAGFAALPSDPMPVRTTRGAHYWVGNEDRLDLFAPDLLALRGKGGVQVGVGTDQNWLFAGWSRPDVVVLMDFDQAIVDLQRVYLVAFQLADTREAFLALWCDVQRTALRQGVIARYRGAERDGALNALSIARWAIERRLRRLAANLASRGVASFLTDDDQYAWVRDLVRAGRAFAVRGDITGPRTMTAIADASRRAGLPVHMFYLSNAEQYFMYQKRTRENFLAFPFDAASIVLRTHSSSALTIADATPLPAAAEINRKYAIVGKSMDAYHYGVQTGASFHAFAGSPLAWSSRQILLWATPEGRSGLSHQAAVDVAVARAAWQEREALARAEAGAGPGAARGRSAPR